MIKSILSSLSVVIGFVAAAQPDSLMSSHKPDTIISTAQIKTSIQTFIRVIGSDDARQYGLKNAAELNSLKPGKQFRKYMIGLNDVRNYQAGTDVEGIIKEYAAVEVSLVSTDGRIRTSVEFVNKNGQWEASRYGSTPELVLLKSVQEAIGDSTIRKGKLIRIPSLSISFIAVPSASGLIFVSLGEHPYLKLPKGKKIAASEAILKLKPYASDHKNVSN